MTRILLALTLLACVPPSTQTSPDTAAQERVLEIDVVATDRNGVPVTDLKPDDLEIWISGRRIPIKSFSAVVPVDGERARRSVVLLLDDVTLSPIGVSQTKEIARRFVNRISAGDQMAVVSLNGAVSSTSTDDPRPLLRSIDAYNVRGGPFLRPEDLAEHVLNTMTSLARQVAEAPARRRTIVAIGAAWLFDTPIPTLPGTRELHEEWTEALRALAAANVTVYVIDPGGVGMSPIHSGGAGFARDTGGHAFVNINDTHAAVERIMKEVSSYYIVGVEDPPFFRTADLRELEVRGKRRGVTVRARRAILGRP